MCNHCEQGDQKQVEVELFQDPVDQVRSTVAVIDLVERAVCGVHRQRRDVHMLAIQGSGGEA